VVSTTIHEDLLFFEPRPYHSQGLSNQDLSQRNTNTLCRGRHQNYTKSEKKSPALEFLLQNKSCCYTKPPVQTSITSSLLHPSKAHRICSVKMAGYSWEDFFLKYFTVILIIFCFVLAFTLGPELACSGGMGGREIFEAFCVAQRALATESCLWARCLDLVHVFSIYVFYFR